MFNYIQIFVEFYTEERRGILCIASGADCGYSIKIDTLSFGGAGRNKSWKIFVHLQAAQNLERIPGKEINSSRLHRLKQVVD